MKIIKNNANLNNMIDEEKEKSKFPIKAKCENCSSEVELEESDLEVGELGLYKFTCPCCGKESYIDDGIALTKDNVRFPQHYYEFKNGVNFENEKIDKYVKSCIKCLRNHKDDSEIFYNTHTGTGDLFINVTRYEGDEEYKIQVAKGYYETYETDIPFEEEDY
jgi:hypothetical protein